MAFIVIFNILCIFCIILGILVYDSYKLGVVEFISIQIVMALTVFYLLYIGHAYIISPFSTRFGRTRHGLLEWGASIASASLCLTFSSFILVFSTIEVLSRCGAILCIMSLINLIFTFTFYVPLLQCVGPIGEEPLHGHDTEPPSPALKPIEEEPITAANGIENTGNNAAVGRGGIGAADAARDSAGPSAPPTSTLLSALDSLPSGGPAARHSRAEAQARLPNPRIEGGIQPSPSPPRDEMSSEEDSDADDAAAARTTKSHAQSPHQQGRPAAAQPPHSSDTAQGKLQPVIIHTNPSTLELDSSHPEPSPSPTPTPPPAPAVTPGGPSVRHPANSPLASSFSGKGNERLPTYPALDDDEDGGVNVDADHGLMIERERQEREREKKKEQEILLARQRSIEMQIAKQSRQAQQAPSHRTYEEQPTVRADEDLTASWDSPSPTAKRGQAASTRAGLARAAASPPVPVAEREQPPQPQSQAHVDESWDTPPPPRRSARSNKRDTIATPRDMRPEEEQGMPTASDGRPLLPSILSMPVQPSSMSSSSNATAPPDRQSAAPAIPMRPQLPATLSLSRPALGALPPLKASSASSSEAPAPQLSGGAGFGGGFGTGAMRPLAPLKPKPSHTSRGRSRESAELVSENRPVHVEKPAVAEEDSWD